MKGSTVAVMAPAPSYCARYNGRRATVRDVQGDVAYLDDPGDWQFRYCPFPLAWLEPVAPPAPRERHGTPLPRSRRSPLRLVTLTFVCDDCSATFPDVVELWRHVATEHGRRPRASERTPRSA